MLLTGDSASGRDAWTSFEAVAEAIPHIAWLADAKGSTDYFNTLGTDYTGLPREVNYGWGWLDLVHPADAERARVGWAHASSTATAFELIYRLRGRDGEFRWHVFRALPIRGDDGEVQRWIGTADELTSQHDASDQARVETQVAQLRTMLETFQPVAGAAARAGSPAPPTERMRPLPAHEAPSAAPAGPAALPSSPSSSARPAPSAPADVAATLGPRELAVARFVATGYTNVEIARLLGLSLRTIEATRSRLRRRAGLESRAAIVRFAREAGLLDQGAAPSPPD